MKKTCSVPGCEGKHHAKGYCNYHYVKIIMGEKLQSVRCSVEGCDNPVSCRFTGLKLCEKHGTRLKRNGSVDIRQRERDIRSFIDSMLLSDSPLDFEIDNNNSFAEISRYYYGDFCQECGWNKGPCEAHHILPKADGGKSTLRNSIMLCPNCHSLKHRNRRERFSEERKAEIINQLNKIREKETEGL